MKLIFAGGGQTPLELGVLIPRLSEFSIKKCEVQTSGAGLGPKEKGRDMPPDLPGSSTERSGGGG